MAERGALVLVQFGQCRVEALGVGAEGAGEPGEFERGEAGGAGGEGPGGAHGEAGGGRAHGGQGLRFAAAVDEEGHRLVQRERGDAFEEDGALRRFDALVLQGGGQDRHARDAEVAHQFRDRPLGDVLGADRPSSEPFQVLGVAEEGPGEAGAVPSGALAGLVADLRDPVGLVGQEVGGGDPVQGCGAAVGDGRDDPRVLLGVRVGDEPARQADRAAGVLPEAPGGGRALARADVVGAVLGPGGPGGGADAAGEFLDGGGHGERRPVLQGPGREVVAVGPRLAAGARGGRRGVEFGGPDQRGHGGGARRVGFPVEVREGGRGQGRVGGRVGERPEQVGQVGLDPLPHPDGRPRVEFDRASDAVASPGQDEGLPFGWEDESVLSRHGGLGHGVPSAGGCVPQSIWSRCDTAVFECPRRLTSRLPCCIPFARKGLRGIVHARGTGFQ